MDAIAHTQVSGLCLVTLVVLLRAQQKMRDKSLPGRQFTALLWFAGALTIVDYGSALAQLGAWEELGIPLTYRLNAGGSILFYLLAACCCLLVFLYVEAELGRTWMEDGRRLALSAAPVALLLLALLTARDENGFHPLCYGKRVDGSYVIASESCALDVVGAEFIREIRPGEILVFGKEGIRSITDHCDKAPERFCVFEYIYFARPDSVINGCSVHDARVRAGEFLADSYPVEADVVIGVPDSGLDAAIGYSRRSGIPYEIGFLKNKYIGRTFIAPGQKSREDRVRIKLNVISSVVKGKRVVLIDDSIVRGTTSARIVKLLRDSGATEVHMRVTAPPFTNPCYYGTDIDSKENLIACSHSLDEIVRVIGVDSLGYLSVDYARRLAGGENRGFCLACFDGNYPTEVPKEKAKSKFDFKISRKKEES